MSTQNIPSLAALLAHPDFQRGLAMAQESFLDVFEPAPLTEKQIVEEITTELNEYEIATEEAPVLWRLGYVIGTVAEGLTYAPKAPDPAQTVVDRVMHAPTPRRVVEDW